MVAFLDEFTELPSPLKSDGDLPIAVSTELSRHRILDAYGKGIFPWSENDDFVLWWSPNERAVIFPHELHISRSLKRTLQKREFTVTKDLVFDDVIRCCAAPRGPEDQGTWITPRTISAYLDLFDAGFATSYECWQNDRLVGGLYGVRLGRIFFAESMFRRVANASKVAMVAMANDAQNNDELLIDVQFPTQHLKSMGATTIPRMEFLRFVNVNRESLELEPLVLSR